MPNNSLSNKKYHNLIGSIGVLLQQARQEVNRQVNGILVKTYWEIGRHIVVYEQENRVKAEYGSKLLDQIAGDLKNSYGKGFSFVARQFRITLGNKHYYIDLVFYHRILKCFVLIDLKLGKVNHQDIGQMNMYLNYFKKEEMAADDNEPIGIVLGAKKDKVLVEFALGGMSNRLFAAKYQMALPGKKLLQQAMEATLQSKNL